MEKMMHPLKEMIIRRENGEKCGISSNCTANELVIEALLERGKATGEVVLIEATANQINQFGGYTGMLPKDFVDFVMKKVDEIGFPHDKLILGGDHLGPLVWSSDTEEVAMDKSKELVRLFVLAGFTKIHLDTSMKLADDPIDTVLPTEVIARRGVELYEACIKAYEELLKANPNALRPVFVVGSEVPVPGGRQEAEDGITVTSPADFADTVETYQQVFRSRGHKNAWEDIIGVVVQPGVEFGDDEVFLYNHKEARLLCGQLKEFKGIVFEGHSTDYQTKEILSEMVEDGIAILKVGPALTFGLREALFSLCKIEEELIDKDKRSDFINELDRIMVESPGYWEKYYHGTTREIELKRKYSFSDRSRYYFSLPEVISVKEKLFDNLSDVNIPLNILHQYMPLQYEKVIRGEIQATGRALAKEGVLQFVYDYEFAIK
jgi:D-tagatose-1,6-bisphosphate aldolase subunit GatZ/KbaZ